jgi:hypothetical protein
MNGVTHLVRNLNESTIKKTRNPRRNVPKILAKICSLCRPICAPNPCRIERVGELKFCRRGNHLLSSGTASVRCEKIGNRTTWEEDLMAFWCASRGPSCKRVEVELRWAIWASVHDPTVQITIFRFSESIRFHLIRPRINVAWVITCVILCYFLRKS